MPNNDPLNKGLPGFLTAASLALGSPTASAPPKPPEPIVEQAPKKWDAKGLDGELHSIAHLESNFGINTKHAPNSKGEYHTAHGAVGLKPQTAHEAYNRSPTIQKLYPNLHKPEDFLHHFKTDPQLYNLTANAHWKYLRKKMGSQTGAAFAWRHGLGAAQRAPQQVWHEDPYVQKYVDLGGLHKAEEVQIQNPSSISLPLEKLVVNHNSLLSAFGNVTRHKGSMSPGPVDVWVTEKGEHLLVDGHHRLAHHLLSGKHGGLIPARVVGSGYTDYWHTPPPNERAQLDSKLKYGGIEHLTDKRGVQEGKKFGRILKSDLTKMSIENVTPGKKKEKFTWDYSHLLTPENKMAGYSLSVSFHPHSVHPILGNLRDRFHGEILHHGKPVGNLSAAIHTNHLNGPCLEPHVTIQPEHQKRGLGTAMYEAVFKEAKSAGIKQIHGFEHSEAASRLHQGLSQRHGMKYKAAKEPDADVEYPYGTYRYALKSEGSLSKAEGEHATTIRSLLASNDMDDWSSALKMRGAGPEDIDFLLDKASNMAATRDDGSAVTWGGVSPAYTMNMLGNSPHFQNKHIHRMMDIPIFRPQPGVTEPRAAMYFAGHNKSDSTVIDKMLDDADTWAPEDNENRGWSGFRPNLQHLIDVRGNTVTPEHVDRVMHMVYNKNDGKLPQQEIDLKDFLYNHSRSTDDSNNQKKIDPKFLEKWFDIATQPGINKHNIESKSMMKAILNAGQRPTDKMFQKIMGLQDADAYGQALGIYSSSKHGMDPKHVDHLLAHPRSFAPSREAQYGVPYEDVASSEDRMNNDTKHAIEQHVFEHGHELPATTLENVLKHPHKRLAENLATNTHFSTEMYRKIYEHRPDLGKQMIGNAAFPDDLRLPMVKKGLDENDDEVIDRLRGGLRNPSPEHAEDEADEFQPYGEALTNLIIDHPNKALVEEVTRQLENLTNEQAVKLVNNGLGADLVRKISNRDYEEQGARPEDKTQYKFDRKAIADAIAQRPNDTQARESLAKAAASFKGSLDQFEESVKDHELANLKDPTKTIGDPALFQSDLAAGRIIQSGFDTVHALVQKHSPTSPGFLSDAVKLPLFSHKALWHPNLPQQDFDAILPGQLSHPDESTRKLTQNTLVNEAISYNGTPYAAHPNIQEKHLAFAVDAMDKDAVLSEDKKAQIYSSNAWSPEKLEQMWHDKKMFDDPRHFNNGSSRALVNNANTPDSVKEDFLTRPFDTDGFEGPQGRFAKQELEYQRGQLLFDRNGVISPKLSRKLLKKLSNNPEWVQRVPEAAKAVNERLQVFEPDSVYRQPLDPNHPDTNEADLVTNHKISREVGAPQGHLQVRPGNQKIRKIRDLIMEKAPEKGEVKPKDLPPGDWSAGRLPNGNISAKKLQEHIDSQEPTEYNFSHTDWTGAQRHNKEAQKVFQVNLTNKMFDQLEAAGVDKTFHKMVGVSQTSSHPVRLNHTIGWVRYTGDKDKGFHIDEVQSDLGQSWVRQAASQAAARGDDETGQAHAAHKAQQEYPDEHLEKIKHIVFAGKHPNEMLLDSFHQYLRDQGHKDVPVHILDAKTKAPLSGQDPTKPLPAHMQLTYSQAPKKMGLEPKSYGALPTQDNPKLTNQPTWGGPVRKSLFGVHLLDWAKEFHIEELIKAVESGDFKGIARATDPSGGATVDHVPHLEPHHSVTKEANDYKENVLNSPTRNKKLSSKNLQGITRKVIYSTKSPSGEESRYMVKPYNERVIRRVKDWMQHPIQGWAEITNHGLFHAAGIGHLHQKVFTAEHNMGAGKEKEPALVIPLAAGHREVADVENLNNVGDDVKSDARKISLLDFLGNNVDRHSGNLLISPEINKLLACDHSRNFQYKAASKPFHRWDKNKQEEVRTPGDMEEDNLGNYARGGAIQGILKPPSHGTKEHDKANKYREDWAQTIQEWWPTVSQSLRKEMDRHLESIRNPTLKEHIHRNFHARADLLDEMANMGVDNYGFDDWDDTPVPMYQYGHKED